MRHVATATSNEIVIHGNSFEASSGDATVIVIDLNGTSPVISDYPTPRLNDSAWAGGLSADGNLFVGGIRASSSDGYIAFVWNRGANVVSSLWPTTTGVGSYASDAASGGIVVGRETRLELVPRRKGNKLLEMEAEHAVLWDAGSTAAASLPEPAGIVQSNAYAISDDASVIVGHGDVTYGNFSDPTGRTSLIWILDPPTQTYTPVDPGPLGLEGELLNRAFMVSDDGAVVAGYSRPSSPISGRHPIRWTQHTGQVMLEGWNPDTAGYPFSMSTNGRIIVGGIDSNFDSVREDGFLWKDDGSQVTLIKGLIQSAYPGLLGGLPAEFLNAGLEIKGVNDDGSVVAAYATYPDGSREGWVLLLTPRAPQIDSLEADATVAVGGSVTLTPAGAVAPAGFLAAVWFYGDFNGDGVEDEPIRQPADPNGYGISFSLGGATAGDTFTYSAIAEDIDGNFSVAVSTTVEVNDAPTEPFIYAALDSLDIIAKTKGRKTDLHVELNVVDEIGDLVAGAEVTVSLTDPNGTDLLDGIGTGVTDDSGRFVSATVRATTSGDYTATVEDVNRDGTLWGDTPGSVTKTEAH